VLTALIILTVLASLGGLVGLLPAMFAPAMLASPGSGRNPATLALCGSVFTFPLFCLLAVGASWLFYAFDNEALALWAFALPGLSLVSAGVAWACLLLFSKGQFNG
jgi:hypothetical protein